MADLTYTMDINGAPALAALGKVEKQLDTLKNTFGGLQSALAGLFAVATISHALQFADTINDIAVSSGIATSSVLGLNAAIATNGGNSEKAAKMISSLSLSIEAANSGALQVSDAFKDVGISLNDLKTLSDTDLLSRTIVGLSKIDDTSKRAALAMKILGKGAKGIDFVGVGDDIGRANQEAMKYTASVQKASAVQDKITSAIEHFEVALLKSIGPLLDYIDGLSPEQINKFVDAVIKMGGAAAAITALGSAFKYVGIIITGIGALWASGSGKITSGLEAISAGWASLSRTAGVAANYVSRFFAATPQFAETNGLVKNLVTLFEKLGIRLGFVEAGAVLAGGGILAFATGIGEVATAIAGVAAATYALGSIFDAVFDTHIVDNFLNGVSAIWDKMKEIAGFKKDTGAGGGRGSYSKDDIAGLVKYGDEQAKQGKVEREQLDARAKAFNEFKLQQTQLVDGYYKQNNAMGQQISFEATLIGKSENEVELLRAKEAALVNQRNIISDLIKEQDKLKLAMGVSGTSANEVADLQARYNEINNTIGRIRKETGAYQSQLDSNIGKLQSAKLLEQDRLNTLERITQQMEKQQALDTAMLQIRQSTQGQLGQAQFEGAQMKRTPLEQKMADIQENARKAALEAGRSFAAMFDDTNMSTQDAEKLAKGLDLIAQKYQEIAKAQTDNLMASRSWEQGWADAFNSYMDNATNAATRAGEVFGAITQNMSSAIDNFVDNGKFSFSDLASSIIKDLIKIELKAQATQLMSALGGGGGIFSFIGNMLGFAEGGSPPINKPSIVGEKGPELFIPRTAGTIVPNGAGAGGGAVTNTYITNNISAIDSKSVAQMFAENRKALLGTVQLAQKELPYGNR